MRSRALQVIDSAELSSLRVDRVVVERGGLHLLADVTVEFDPGRITAVSGPSGSGKTTLLSVAGGLLQPTSGTARLGATAVWQGTGDPIPDVVFVLQVYGLIPILSARENVALALRARGVTLAEAEDRADAALGRFNLIDLGNRQVEELSGGQMQRVALARALVVGADVILADEPTSELDDSNRDRVLAELREEAHRGAVVVIATHDAAVVSASDVHVSLDEGHLNADPDPDPDPDRAAVGRGSLR